MQCPKKMTEVWHHCNLSLETLQPCSARWWHCRLFPTLSCSHWVVVNVWELCIPFWNVLVFHS
ncbi:unnamed protein product [Staurois parvus]|uniref:Uncharacterized protein n=1 Tax=Staurois parvus TaxID=386267 RepID=A0ABN9FXA3_9NEOB|nr:unnamed protein product [Staurois parvus]